MSNTKNHIPVFIIQDKEAKKAPSVSPFDNADQLSFFDIKELYDRAYAALETGNNDLRTKELMAEAVKMDMAYRCQLARGSKYGNQYKTKSKINDFRVITNTTQTSTI